MSASDHTEAARAWLAEDPDPNTRAELQKLLDADDRDGLAERFHQRLEFGTAGIRGVLGAGPGRMNRALVRQVTAGLATYLEATVPGARERGVVVARDGRHLSPEFAEDAARVLAGFGFRVHVIEELAPTPLCAFAVTHLGAAAGVMVTASHNPPEYNGYKVYWENGAQIVPPHDQGISAAIDAVESIAAIPLAAAGDSRMVPVPDAVAAAYIDQVAALRVHPGTPGGPGVVYTPMHGVGGVWVERAFAAAGLPAPHPVTEQARPDGDFPTVRFPNPEEPGALDLALAHARRVNADLILANDPDADRLAVSVRDGEDYRALTGNEIGTLLGYYLLTERSVDRPVVMTTIVSSSVLSAMAAELGAGYEETLTGFKWIANAGLRREAQGETFLFGFEEALGYTVSGLVRDKDGVGAAVVFADLAAWCAARGQTVLEYLSGIWQRFGVYASGQKSVTLPGAKGAAEIAGIMERFRAHPPRELAGVTVVAVSDLQSGVRRDAQGTELPLTLPASNVLVFELEDKSRVLLRPSGTEPKIKYYFEVVEPVQGSAVDAASDRAAARLAELQNGFLAAL